MKNIKKIIQKSILALSLFLFADNISAQTISTHFFGQNAWMPNMIGTTVYNGKLDQHWHDIGNSKSTIIRYGGIGVDQDFPTNAQYVSIIDSARANGMEPVIEVPYNNGQYTPQQAAAIVTYINVTKGKNIKYWIVGNEPDLGYSMHSSSQVANYFKPFASAMKAADPSIKIIGPETAWFDQSVINGLTTPNGADDITGTDNAGRFYCDIISFHSYGFDGTQNRAQVVGKITAANSFQDNLIFLNTRIAACNTAHNRTGNNSIKTAVTEANVDYASPSNDNLQGVGASSFLGGQYMAELFGVGMKYNLDFINMWSTVEGNNAITNNGYIDPPTGNKKPTYYHFQMMAENFSGTVANCTDNQANVKEFASKNGQQISVLIMNEELSGAYNYTVRLNTAAIAGNNPLKINVDAGVAAEYTGAITDQSSVLLVFNAQGQIVKKYEYTLASHAMANLAPTVTNYTVTGVAAVSGNANVQFDLQNIYPNPCAEKMTIALTKGTAAAEQPIEVQMINLLGQVVYSKKLDFVNGKEEIELNPSLASGEYIVRVKEGEKDNYKVKKIIVRK